MIDKNLLRGKIEILYKKFNKMALKLRDLSTSVTDLEEASHEHYPTTTTTTTTTTSTTAYSDYSDYSGDYESDDSYSNSQG